MTRTADILVIGGGIIGLLTAREFSVAGARTTLIERHKVGQEASWAGGGILFPLYPWKLPETIASLCLKSLEHYPRLAEDLHQQTGIDAELITSGMLVCDNLDDQNELCWCTEHCVRATQLSCKQIESLFPKLNPSATRSLWLPDVCQIRNPRLVKALRKDLSQRGVKIYENLEVQQLLQTDARVVSVKTTHGNFSADRYVVTAGAWSNTLLESNQPTPPVFPVKGEMLLYKTEPGLLQHIVLNDDKYLIPRLDGHILVGSTLEYCGFQKTPTEDARKSLRNFAISVFPPLAKYTVLKHWAGLRPGSPSGIPFIGIHPKIENLSFNCGHFRNGFTMAPASAQLLVDLVLNRPTSLSHQAYALDAER